MTYGDIQPSVEGSTEGTRSPERTESLRSEVATRNYIFPNLRPVVASTATAKRSCAKRVHYGRCNATTEFH